jgi:hypothetical protein
MPEHEWDSETEPPKNERLELQSPEGRTIRKASNAVKSGRLSATGEVEENHPGHRAQDRHNNR